MSTAKHYICVENFLQKVENALCTSSDGSISLDELKEFLEEMPKFMCCAPAYDDHDVSGLIEED